LSKSPLKISGNGFFTSSFDAALPLVEKAKEALRGLNVKDF
jgi:hypothetical protein